MEFCNSSFSIWLFHAALTSLKSSIALKCDCLFCYFHLCFIFVSSKLFLSADFAACVKHILNHTTSEKRHQLMQAEIVESLTENRHVVMRCFRRQNLVGEEKVAFKDWPTGKMIVDFLPNHFKVICLNWCVPSCAKVEIFILPCEQSIIAIEGLCSHA